MFQALRRLVAWAFSLAILAAVVLFAISNPERVTLHLSPVPYAIETPIYFFALCVLMFGAMLGYCSGRRGKAEERRHHKETLRQLAALEHEVASLRKEDEALRHTIQTDAAIKRG